MNKNTEPSSLKTVTVQSVNTSAM